MASGSVRLGSPPWPVRGNGIGSAGVRRLADLRIGALRRQQGIGIEPEIGECGVDERLDELPG